MIVANVYYYYYYYYYQGKGKFGKLGVEKSCIVVMVPLGPPSARPKAQALRLPFEYY